MQRTFLLLLGVLAAFAQSDSANARSERLADVAIKLCVTNAHLKSVRAEWSSGVETRTYVCTGYYAKILKLADDQDTDELLKQYGRGYFPKRVTILDSSRMCDETGTRCEIVYRLRRYA